ncbi:sushi, von Willebrand factor type A, EGF and pentraxin domain-containing protein 1-like [Ptychodera flava]|uniref:sushi, von Willebrand factor type A, EGF and pentraxin domain-containing protein 1-like n=1 Tax=Ptychodera flava TaxID=63121 RepID=UPI00396A6811
MGITCENGGTCCDDGEMFTCHCTEGFTGEYCHEEARPCELDPCENGGLCVVQEPGYVCSCPIGFGGEHCEYLVLVPVDSGTAETDTHCTSVLIRWEASGVGLEPEYYKVQGAVLGGSEIEDLCDTRANNDPRETSCFASGLERSATYTYHIVSISGEDSVESDVITFTLGDHPTFSFCPGDPDPVYADGVEEARVSWDEPIMECLGEDTLVEYPQYRPDDYFPIGTTHVVYRLVEKAEILDTCEFYVTVKERGVCTAYGDPHYMSFNNDYYSFQGVCAYMLVTTSQNVSPRFNVTVLHEEVDSNPDYSITKEVNVTIYDTVISLMEDGEVRINGITVRLPVKPAPGVYVARNGTLVSLHTDFDLIVSFDGKHQVVVKAPADPYKYEIGGLCDHYGKDGSMYIMPGGRETEDVDEFGHSWAIEECDPPVTNPHPTCDDNDKCDLITDKEGPFSDCHEYVDPKPFYGHCRIDYCVNGDYCPVIEAYQRRCRDLGHPVREWRNEDTCPMVCVNGTEYDWCRSQCTDTCVEPDAKDNCQRTECMEGCFCPDGTVLHDDECIDPKDCDGCYQDGLYLKPGDIIVNPECTESCICTENNEMECTEIQCHQNASCITWGGKRKCVCDAPYYEGPGLICRRKCDDPGSPDNGGQNENHDYPVSTGEEVTYYCNSGYMLYDPNAQSCMDSARTICEYGFWSHPVPECRIECTDPGTPEQGQQVGNITYPVCTGTEITFDCDPLHELIGSPSTTCEEGSWSEEVPICRPLCVDPGNPENGHQLGNNTYPVSEGTTVGFSCNEGFSLYDKDDQMCLESYSMECKDGSWSEPLPTCHPMCYDPGTPDDGFQVDPPPYPVCEGTEILYQCHYMHQLIGYEKTVCQDGLWSNPVPECRIMCDDPGSPQYGGQIGDPVYPISNGTVVEFYCISTYDLIDPSDATCRESYHTVCVDGEWTHALPFCEAECVDPGTPSDGSQLGAIEYPVCSGTCVPFECDEMHELHGEEIICCDDGDWSSPIPSCNPTCEDPGHPNHGRQVGDHDYPVSEGYVVEFQCDDSYVLFNNGTKECIASSKTTCHNGTWTDPLPLCKQPCDDPGTPSDGFQTTENTYPVCTATIVGYECDEGFEMIGFHSTICHDSDWMIDMPFCRPLCNDPGTPENGHQIDPPEYPVSEEKEIEFACDPGYSLHNPTTDECEEEWSTVCENGNWTQPLPVCRLECDDPGTPSDGYQIGEPVYPVCSGTEIAFECDENFSLYDPESRVCLNESIRVCNNGVWSEDPPPVKSCVVILVYQIMVDLKSFHPSQYVKALF